MAAVDLRFSQARDTTPPYDLVFGAGGGGSTTASLAVAATLSAPTLTCSIGRVPVVTLSATLPAPALDQVIQAVRDLDMDDVHRQVAEAQAAEPEVPEELRD